MLNKDMTRSLGLKDYARRQKNVILAILRKTRSNGDAKGKETFSLPNNPHH